jgi:hypothetical protein
VRILRDAPGFIRGRMSQVAKAWAQEVGVLAGLAAHRDQGV